MWQFFSFVWSYLMIHRKAKKKLVRNPTKRDNIKTASKYDLKRTKKKK